MNNPTPETRKAITQVSPEVIALHEKPTLPQRPRLVMILSILGMILLIAGIAGWKALQISKAIAMGKAFRMPPDAVTSLVVKESETAPFLEAVGSLASPQGVMLGADLPGTIAEILFESGSHATNGQVLVRLDTRQEEAQLRTAKARIDLARQNLDRARDLGAKRVIAQSALDEAKSQYDAAAASDDETQAMIDRKTIRAPLPANSASARSIPVNTSRAATRSSSSSPSIRSTSTSPCRSKISESSLWASNCWSGRTAFRKRLSPAGSRPSTRRSTPPPATSRVQGTVANPGHLLRSGMFAGVRVILPDMEKAIMVPATAIQYAPYGDSIFVIETMKDPRGRSTSACASRPSSWARRRATRWPS